MPVKSHTVALVFDPDTFHREYSKKDGASIIEVVMANVSLDKNNMTGLLNALTAQSISTDGGIAIPNPLYVRLKSTVRRVIAKHGDKREEFEAILDLPYLRILTGPEVMVAKLKSLGADVTLLNASDDDHEG